VLESEVKELKLKLQEAERKLRIAELRIADLAYDNSELKKRLNLYEKTTGSGTVTTSPRLSDSNSSSGTINTSASGSSKGAKAAGAVKRFIPGRRNGH
jgi:cell shape-determining protein MreC